MAKRQEKTSKRKQKLININARIPADLSIRIKDYANLNGRKLQSIVACALEDYITKIGNPSR